MLLTLLKNRGSAKQLARRPRQDDHCDQATNGGGGEEKWCRGKRDQCGEEICGRKKEIYHGL